MRDTKSFFALGFVAALAFFASQPAGARSLSTIVDDAPAAGGNLIQPKAPGHLECVPYARTTSGIQIYGDAHTWWGQARGRYATGQSPRVGAVMAIEPHNNSHLGHVATVSRIVDSRTVLLSHANWSYRGKIERNVTALDVSPDNDWSEVRIWYGPSQALGTTHWPVRGFIYNARPGSIRDTAPARTQTFARTTAGTKTSRGRDPIGAIIAGRY